MGYQTHHEPCLLEKFPGAEIHNEICLATQVRQEAVAEQVVSKSDLVIVVGDHAQ